MSELRTASLKNLLHADLTTAMKARDELTTATLRMALTAVTTEEVAGKAARELSDDEVLRVLTREGKKRREAAEAYDQAQRPELAARERAEGEVIDRYLPSQLDDAELVELVRAAVAETGATGPRDMGAVMKAVQPKVAGRADGKRVSSEVRTQLSG
ncbi:GatB/YqeY domain-containing protein [uncultured Jatrophihabitans sp.]|uniref:GatB/YqeY domain-containing protein n=1 Tax=uncultured Jatrophihabitans sp. TaxID=1610747 RepID=UPI0035CA5D27